MNNKSLLLAAIAIVFSSFAQCLMPSKGQVLNRLPAYRSVDAGDSTHLETMCEERFTEKCHILASFLEKAKAHNDKTARIDKLNAQLWGIEIPEFTKAIEKEREQAQSSHPNYGKKYLELLSSEDKEMIGDSVYGILKENDKEAHFNTEMKTVLAALNGL